MAIYKILATDEKTIRARYNGTRKEAENWADNHYIKHSWIVERDKEFERKWKIKG